MDPTVVAALAKWPDVPAVYGWLGLTARGEWRLQGQPIGNLALCEFIGRNYSGDERGRWYFQNGPQRVFVTLEAAPWVWQVAQDAGTPALQSHTGVRTSQLRGAWLDESGRIFLMTDLGFGLLDSRDSGSGCLMPLQCQLVRRAPRAPRRADLPADCSQMDRGNCNQGICSKAGAAAERRATIAPQGNGSRPTPRGGTDTVSFRGQTHRCLERHSPTLRHARSTPRTHPIAQGSRGICRPGCAMPV